MKPRSPNKVTRSRRAPSKKATLGDRAASTPSDSGVNKLTDDKDKGFDLNNTSTGWDSGKQVGNKI
jgi:hypothetical protein